MERRTIALWMLCAAPIATAAEDAPLRLKQLSVRESTPAPGERRLDVRRRHLVLEFARVPGGREWRDLAARGVRPLAFIPDRGLIAAVPDTADPWIDGLEHVQMLEPARKWSREMLIEAAQTAVVEFHRDVEPWEARGIVLREGLNLVQHPDLRENHLLIEGDVEGFRRLASWDEVAYIFPASSTLERGEPVYACAGAVTAGGPVGQYISTVGPGWDGYGQGSAVLTYSFQQLSRKLPDDAVQEEIGRAMAEWSKYVRVTFLPGGYPTSRRHVDYLFARGDYGSFYPFDGPGRVLAHTFYPSPPNPEPVAGDVHFDDDEPWNIGARIDLFSVALHELGHALGLAHSDSPKDVMYPYYRMATELAEGDISSIRSLYKTTEPEGPIQPLRLEITTPKNGAQTLSAWTRVSGSAGGGVGPLWVKWSSGNGASGSVEGTESWQTSAILLRYGSNVINVSVVDSRGEVLSRSVTVERVTELPEPPSEPKVEPPSEPEPGEPEPPTATDTTAPAIRVLYPTSANTITSVDTVELRGLAIDGSGVTKVTWSVNTGESGTAFGTGFWRSGPIRLLVGINIITVRAFDPAGNNAWRSVMVTRR